MRNHVLWIVKNDLTVNWPSFIATLLGTLLMAMITGVSLDYVIEEMYNGAKLNNNTIFLDIIFLGITPSFVTLFISGPYLSFRTLKEDPFSRKLALLRSLPISIKSIFISRIVLMCTYFILFTICFYIVVYSNVSESSLQQFDFTSLIYLFLFWSGYALATGSILTYMEYGTNGKKLFLSQVVSLFLIFIVITFMIILFQTSVTEWSIKLIRDYQHIPVLCSILIGSIGFVTTTAALRQRLINRDYI